MKIDEKKIKVTLEDGRKYKVAYKTKVKDLLLLTGDNLKDILAVKINNEVKTYESQIYDDSHISYVKYNGEDGYRIYTKTLKMILYMALTRLFSHADVEFIATISKDQYFVIKNIEVTTKKLQEVKAEMIKIIEKDYPIEKRIVPFEEAEVLYKASKDDYKLRILSNKLRSNMTMYFCDGLYNYFYGVLAPSTGYVGKFDLIKYKDGVILSIPPYNGDHIKNISETIYDTFISYNKLNSSMGLDSVGKINELILKQETNSIIQVSEAIHNRKLVELVLDIEKRKNIKIILIAGPSSSGKTTFAQKLGVQLNLTGYRPVKISMDNYFKDRDQTPLGPDGKYDFETVDALDLELFNTHLSKLLNKDEILVPTFNFHAGVKEYKGKTLRLQDKDILIIEGIHALNPILTNSVEDDNKYKIYIAPITTLSIDGYTKVSSTDTRILRRMLRDYSTRGHSVERTLDLWRNVKIGEEKYIFPFVESVDYMYNSSHIYEPCVMRNYVQPLLLQLDKTSPYYSESRRLYEYLNNFLPMDSSNIPIDSVMREFIGGGCFER